MPVAEPERTIFIPSRHAHQSIICCHRVQTLGQEVQEVGGNYHFFLQNYHIFLETKQNIVKIITSVVK